AIQAKQAELDRVLHEVQAIDERVTVVDERYDAARVRLGRIRAQERAEEHALAKARVRYRAAEDRLAGLLVTPYESGRPSALETILGAQSFSEMLTVLEAQDAIGRQDDAIAAAAFEARRRVEHHVATLAARRTAAASTVGQLGAARSQIEGALARRRA